MKFWNYIGGFFLFRWLVSKLQPTEDSDAPGGNAGDYQRYSSDEYESEQDDWNTQSYDVFDEEQDDYDMMDDF